MRRSNAIKALCCSFLFSFCCLLFHHFFLLVRSISPACSVSWLLLWWVLRLLYSFSTCLRSLSPPTSPPPTIAIAMQYFCIFPTLPFPLSLSLSLSLSLRTFAMLMILLCAPCAGLHCSSYSIVKKIYPFHPSDSRPYVQRNAQMRRYCMSASWLRN